MNEQTNQSRTPILSFQNISKTFGGTVALDRVSLDVYPGTVHILAGENGAGKSTLMKILMGVHPPDSGTILWKGQVHTPRSPAEALKRGIAMIYQELTLALHLPAHANVFLGQELSASGFVREAEQIRRCQELFQRLSVTIDPMALPRDLGIAQRQLIEIARALAAEADLIVMDEPTAALSEQEAATLFKVIRSLRERGVAVIYISHYLEEFGEIGDEVTVLRDGRRVHHAAIQNVTVEEIISHMVGRQIEELYPKHNAQAGEVILRIEGLTSPNGTHTAEFEVRAGEVVGIAGLVGAGRTEMLRAMFGLDPAHTDHYQLKSHHAGREDTDIEIHYVRPDFLVACGVGYLSEDRAAEGLAQRLSIAINTTLSSINRCTTRMLIPGWWVSDRLQNRLTETYMRQLNIKAASPLQKVGELSGGNQQKVAIARLLSAEARVFLLDEPTRGIDIGAKQEIYRLLMELAAKGRGVVVVSSYLPELFGICDSIYVMSRGTLSRKYAIEEIDEHGVMTLATGLTWEPGHVE